MICRVDLDGRHYQVELRWDKVEIPPGGHAWWLGSITGEPRPARHEVREIYRRALKQAEQAMRAERSDR